MKKILKKISAVLMLTTMLSTALAGEAWVMPDLTENANLIISYTYDNEKVKLEGAEISIYKVADVSVYNGNVTYTMDEYYGKQLGEDFVLEEMTVASSKELALRLDTKDRKADAVVITDAEGKAVFSDIPYGIYLVKETGKTKKAAEYENFDNYLLSVPGIKLYDERQDNVATHGDADRADDSYEEIIKANLDYDGEWVYTVVTTPKTGTEKIPQPDTPPTGDILQLISIISLAGLLAGAGIMYIAKKTSSR